MREPAKTHHFTPHTLRKLIDKKELVEDMLTIVSSFSLAFIECVGEESQGKTEEAI